MPDNPLDAEAAANRQRFIDAQTTARQAGASWDQIHQTTSAHVQRMRDAGATEQQIMHSYGFKSPDELIAATQTSAQQHMAATRPTGWLEAFANGLTHSSAAALLGIKPNETPIQGRGARIVAGLAEAAGDLPASIAGGVVGAIGGGAVGAVGGAGAGAAVPVAGETGASEVAGGVAGGAVGAYAGAAAGAGALPQLIKSERDRYMKALASGQVKGPEDFLSIQAGVMKDTAEAAAVGLATAKVGSTVGAVASKMGAGKVTKFLATAGSEAATMTAAQSALAGHMPRMEDFVDASVTIGAFHTAAHIAAPASRAIRTRLMQNYAATGETPQDAAHRAVNDPIFRAQMMGQPDPHVPAGSSRTSVTPHHEPAPGQMSGPHTPLPSDQFIIPRVAGDFDHAVQWIFKQEGGLTTDTGGVTKYGISANAHPGVDIAHISQEDAAHIYHQEYWRAIDADALPPNMRLAAFDSAVNQGVGQTKTWLAQSRGDLQEFMKLRIEKYAKLARDPKYSKYANSWAHRLEDLGASKDMVSVIRHGPDNVGREFSPEDKAAIGAGGEGGGKPPEDEGQTPQPPKEEGDPLSRIMDREAEGEAPDRWGATLRGVERIYTELFDKNHPVRKLWDGVTKGDSLDDYRNPEILGELAANSGEVAKRVIDHKMVDLDGNITGPGFREIVEGRSTGQKFSPKEQRVFLAGYARARYALMMEDQGKQTGIDAKDAEAVIAKYGEKYGEAFQHLVDLRNGTLRWLTNVHGADKVEKLIADNSAPMPGYREMEDGSHRPIASGKQGLWDPIRTAKGSKRQFKVMSDSIMQDIFLRHQLAMGDRTVNAIADAGIESNQASERRLVNFNVVNAIDALKETGIQYGPENLDTALNSLVKAAGGSIKDNEVPRFKDGKLYAVTFDDPEVTRTLRGYDAKTLGTTLKIIRGITAVPRALQTRLNPFFAIRNVIYDIAQQHIANPDAMTSFLNPLSNLYSGLGHLTGNTEVYHQWANSGGADHIFTALGRDDYIKSVLRGQEELSLASGVWNAVKSPFDLLHAWTRMASIPMRLGRYARGLEEGESKVRAAAASTQSAFHPANYGGPLGKAWNQLVPYSLAHLRTLDQDIRAHLGQWGPAFASKITGADFQNRTPLGTKYSAARTMTRGLAWITLPVVVQWFHNKDEEWYKAMPDWQKNNSWFIIPPTEHSAAIPIPAPPLVSFFYAALPRMIMEQLYADNPHAFDHAGEALGESLLPAQWLLGASILTPVVEHIADHSFHKDRPLVSEDTQKGVQPAEQFTQYSTPAAKDLAQYVSDLPLVHSNLGWSPQIIDNYISQWGGPMGRAAVNAADSVLAGGKRNAPPEQHVSEWPGISSWAVRYPNASAAPIQQFYDTSTKLDQEHGSLLKEIRESNFDAFKRIVDQGGASAAAYHHTVLGNNAPPNVDIGPYMDYLAQAAAKADYQDMALVREASNALKNARDYSHSVYEDPLKTAHDKRQILDMVNAQMQAISERGNEAADRALIGVKHAGHSAHVAIPSEIHFEPPQ